MTSLVKPLEWFQTEGIRHTWYADTILGRYSAWEGYYGSPGSYGGIKAGKTVADAKAAALSHYEAHILSALTSDALMLLGGES